MVLGEDKLSDNKAEKIIDLALGILDLTATGGIPILSSIKEAAKCIKDIPNEIFLIKLDRFIKAVISKDEKGISSFKKMYKRKYLNNEDV